MTKILKSIWKALGWIYSIYFFSGVDRKHAYEKQRLLEEAKKDYGGYSPKQPQPEPKPPVDEGKE